MCCRLLTLVLVACWLTSAGAQSNDNFAGRLTLSGSSATVVSNNLHATRETGEPNHAGNAAGRSLWWTWTAPSSGVFNFSTFSGSSGVAPPRVLAVYTGSSLAALTEAASSNDAPYSYFASENSDAYLTGTAFNLAATAGTTYQIAVDAAEVPLARANPSDDGTVVLSINAAPTIVSAASVNATSSTAFRYSILASNNPTAYAATNLPPDLSLNRTSGVISGTVPANGTYTIGLSATGPGGTGTATLTVQVVNAQPVVPAVPVIESSAAASGCLGTAFSYEVYASGYPISYNAANLPAGLSFNDYSGYITGTPTAAGTFLVPLSATNGVGTGSATLTIVIAAAPPVPIFTSALTAAATVGAYFSYGLSTNLDGTSFAPTSYAVTGSPPGLGLSAENNGFIEGVPTQVGTYAVNIAATNAGGTGTATLTITVSAAAPYVPPAVAPTLNSSATASGAVYSAFSYTLAANTAVTSFGASNLPPGLILNTSTGVISGAPTAAGTFAVPVSAANAYGTANATLTITVYPSVDTENNALGVDTPAITSPAEVVGYTNQALSYQVQYNRTNPYSLDFLSLPSYNATGLPPGLTLQSSPYNYFPVIAGTPTSPGVYAVTLTVTGLINSSIYSFPQFISR